MVKGRILVLFVLAVVLMATVGAAAAVAQNTESTSAESTSASSDHITVKLQPVNGTDVHGTVDLRQLSGGGTHIDVTAKGLRPGSKHVSLYYDNHVCQFEPYNRDDVIGGIYKANQNGVGHTADRVDDNLDEINSVSVRSALTFKLLACADVHPA
jgi:opacity protein-like surface antigen